MMKPVLFAISAAVFYAAGAAAAEPRFSGEKIPRFAAIRSAQVSARVGPGPAYPVKYVYRSKFQPVQIVNEYYGWYQIKDISGDMSWVYRNYLAGAGYATPVVDGVLLYKKARADSAPLAKVGRGIVFLISKCDDGFCAARTNVDGTEYRGYLLKDGLFGI
jgi:SH3-like domain-containing protein